MSMAMTIWVGFHLSSDPHLFDIRSSLRFGQKALHFRNRVFDSDICWWIAIKRAPNCRKGVIAVDRSAGLLLLKDSFSWRTPSLEGLLLLQDSFSCRTPSLEGLLLLKDSFSRRTPSLAGLLLLKDSFSWRTPSLEELLLFKDSFSRRTPSLEGLLLQIAVDTSAGLLLPNCRKGVLHFYQYSRSAINTLPHFYQYYRSARLLKFEEVHIYLINV